MKKIISLILALVLVLGLATVASAAEVTGNVTFEKYPEEGETEWSDSNVSKNDVTVTVAGESNPVYKVVVEWGTLNFTYTRDNGVWNPDTHAYTTSDTGFGTQGGKVTITNHSNAKITYTATFADDSAADNVTVLLSNPSDTLDGADTGNYLNNGGTSAPSGEVNYTPSGTPSTIWEGGKIGTISVAISPAA